MDLNRIRENIRDMLRLAADDAASQGEIDNAIRISQRLIREYHLSEDEIFTDVKDRIEDADCISVVVKGDKSRLTAWEGSLALWISQFTGCKVYQTSGSGYSFYGVVDSVEFVVELFQEMRATILAMAHLKWGGAHRGKGRCYCEGFITGIRSRAQLCNRQEPGTSLVVRQDAIIEAKQARAAQWLATSGVKLQRRATSSTRSHHHGAYQSGLTDGKASSLPQRNHTRKLT